MQYYNFNDAEYQNKIYEFQENIKKLTYKEKDRKEEHGNSRIIFNREIPPVNIYQNVMNNTTFIYRNRVPSEGGKLISRLKGIRGKKIMGSVIQWIGVLMTVISAYMLFFYDIEDWDANIKGLLAVLMLSGVTVFLIIGGIIRTRGRAYMSDYIEVWNPLKAPVEINRLANGQLAVIKYINRDKSCGLYKSALNPDDTIQTQRIDMKMIPTYAMYIYIIDQIKSCEKTKNGVMVESSGRYYGARWAWKKYNTHTNKYTWYYVFTETHISYKKEEIPDIFTDMEQLEASLMNYGYYEEGRNGFYPL